MHLTVIIIFYDGVFVLLTRDEPSNYLKQSTVMLLSYTAADYRKSAISSTGNGS